MKTLKEYISFMRRMQTEFDSERVKKMVRETNSRTGNFYEPHSGITLYAGDDNQVLGLNINLEQTLEMLKESGLIIESITQRPTTLFPFRKAVTQYIWRNQSQGIFGYTALDPEVVHFKYEDSKKLVTPIGLEIERPSAVYHDGRERSDAFAPIQTVTGIFPDARIGYRIIEDSVLAILEFIVKNDISGFYGRFKSFEAVANLPEKKG